MENKKQITSWDQVPLDVDLDMAAEIVGLHRETLKKKAQTGEFPAVRRGKRRQWRISKRKLREYVEGY